MKSISLLFAVVAISVLAGCTRSTTEVTANYVLPAELSDCKIFNLVTDQGQNMQVMRCPNSMAATSYSTGSKAKTYHNNIVIDGVTYTAAASSPDPISP